MRILHRYVVLILLVMTSCMFRPPRDRQPPPDQSTQIVVTQAAATTVPATATAATASQDGGTTARATPPVAATATTSTTQSFQLTSAVVANGGMLPADYTCDGTSATVPLAWSNAPAGTVSFAVIMHHVAAPDDVHWYWVLYNIPADVTQLAQNSTGIGTLGTNSVNDRNEYAPPCSKGPGPKKYTYTVYALSAQPQVPSSGVDRDTLLAAMSGITLASATLDVVYSRP